MKKVFSIFLTVIFLISAMGMTINSHFCGKKLSSVGILAQDCSCKKKSGMKKGCCKNEIKYVKITDDYSPSSQFHVEKINIAPIVLDFSFPSAIGHLTSSILVNSHSPPPKFADRVIAFHSILV
ncbi:MAG: hypothetical protein HY841_00555 [Bacteroidetes bacterium]|nr:hypothetical protein [Bacteroidota bacterium]